MTYISGQISDNRQSVIVWQRDAQGDRDYRVFRAPYFFYIADEHGEFLDIYGNKLKKLEFDSCWEFLKAKEDFKRQGIKLYESDIGPEFKILSQNYYNKPVGKLNITFYDIEVNYDKTIGFSTVDNPYAPVSAIAMYHMHSDTFVTYVVPPTPDWTMDKIPSDITDIAEVVLCKDEAQLLKFFLAEIEDTDVLSGFNSTWFDAPYLYFRLLRVLGEAYADKLSFPGAKAPKIKEVEMFGRSQKTIEFFGRVSLDFREVFMKLHPDKLANYSLEAVTEEIVPKFKKMEYEGSLHDLYYNNFLFFIRYNIRDTEALKALEEKLRYVQFSINFSHAATGLIPNVLGTIKLTELAIINYCHYNLNRIVPDSKTDLGDVAPYLGAFVLDPQVGMHDWVSAVDIKSLYPSTMRSLNISPEAIVGQFMEKHRAYELFAVESDEELTLVYESGVAESKTPKEWKKILLENGWCISGYGTVFSLQTEGVITSILSDWFSKRIEYQREIKTLTAQLKDVIKGTPEYEKLEESIGYYDKLQYIFKIRLNSIYGAQGNQYFKFYDVRMAESVTRSGREILMHMVRKTAELQDGKYIWPSASTLYSDTDSCYFATKTDNEQDALSAAKDITNKINESFPDFMSRAFLCNEKHNTLITAEQEIVAKKAILVTKKLYILKIVNKDGKSVNKTKIMGHKIKKTILPKAVKLRLTPFIEQLMEGRDWHDIGKDLVAYKEELKNSPNIFELGLPQGTTKVDTYTDHYIIDTKTRLPGAVAASIFYNKCLEDYKDKGNHRISNGMKIRVFYLKKMFGRFKSIALPADTRELPGWFVEHFMPIVDRDAQVERLVDQTMQNILKAIGKIMPTKKSLLVDELVEY